MPVIMSWMSGLPFWRGLCGAWVALAAVAKVAVLLGLGRIGDPDTSGRRSPRPKKDSSELLPLVLLLLERVNPGRTGTICSGMGTPVMKGRSGRSNGYGGGRMEVPGF